MRKLYVYIGRFQPFHNGHLSVLNRTASMMKKDDGLLVLVGSADRQDSFANPLSWRLRLDIVNGILKDLHSDNYMYATVINDSPYNYDQWVYYMQCVISEQMAYLTESGDTDDVPSPCLVGMDGIKKYAEMLGYPYVKMPETVSIHGTDVRNRAADGCPVSGLVPPSVLGKLVECGFGPMMRRIRKAQDDYYSSTGCKYSTCFCTVDAIVVAGGSVLLVRRKDNGKYALPGGFQDPMETALDGAMRELYEETGLNVRDNRYFKLERGPLLFDAPGRDYRCGPKVNAPTHAFLWRFCPATIPAYDEVNRMLGTSETSGEPRSIGMPDVHSGDDASSCEFVKLGDIGGMEASDFHGDHKKIICNVLGLPYGR